MAFSKPPGSVDIWNNVKIIYSKGINREFFIQEIPENRYDEAVDHMCSFFARDETVFSYFKIAEDPIALAALRKSWNLVVRLSFSIAAYDITENSDKPILAGVHILYIGNNTFDETLTKFEYEGIMKKILTFTMDTFHEVDPRYTYGIDEYLGELSIHPNYRRLGLAKNLLKARDDVGLDTILEYNIQYTTSMFTSEISKKAGDHCNFIVKMDRSFDSVLDEDGNKLFPLLVGKRFTIMEKEIFKK